MKKKKKKISEVDLLVINNQLYNVIQFLKTQFTARLWTDEAISLYMNNYSGISMAFDADFYDKDGKTSYFFYSSLCAILKFKKMNDAHSCVELM